MKKDSGRSSGPGQRPRVSRTEVAGRSSGPGQRPRVSRTEVEQLAARIRYDLTAAQAKITELMTMLNSLPIPDEPTEPNLAIARLFVENTAHVYTDGALEAELRGMGADDAFIREMLELAASVREKAAAA